MNKKIFAVLATLVLMILPMSAQAASQNAPATYSVSIVINKDVSFTVTITPGFDPVETSLRFSGSPGETDINAIGQNDTIPWAMINNTGVETRNFTIGLASDPPTGVTLSSSNVSAMTGEILVNKTIRELVGGNLLPGVGTTLDVFIKADYDSSISCISWPCTYSNTVTFRNYLPALNSIVVSGPATVFMGYTGTYSASGKDQYNNVFPVTVTWASSNSSIATINSNTGVLTPVIVGTVVVNATSGSVVGNKTVTISVPI